MRAADDVDAYVGGQLRVRRMLLGISQEQMGEALGLTFQQIQKYEKGQNRIGAGRLYRIAQILSVPVEYFYDGLPQAGETDESRIASERTAEIQRFLSSAEGQSLTAAFLRIKDAATRRRLIELVNTIADGAG